ncbi:MAG: hypothetical protein GYA24_14110 [Candidatus Lokiarchaeota archaeon]|nr:hypothetical protein [Candidatus Lokiarchaeota archaeon]
MATFIEPRHDLNPPGTTWHHVRQPAARAQQCITMLPAPRAMPRRDRSGKAHLYQ